MDDDTMTSLSVEGLLDGSVEMLREHRREMAAWLALEVLQFDPVAQQDRDLIDRLVTCQERLEARLRAKAATRQSPAST